MQGIQVVDAYFGEYLDCPLDDLADGELRVAASSRRARREAGYASIFPLWMVIADGRCALSVHEPLLDAVGDLVGGRHPLELQRPVLCQQLQGLARTIYGGDVKAISGPLFYCTPASFTPRALHPCRAVGTGDVNDLLEGGLSIVGLERSLCEGTCFASYADGRPVALAGAHDIGHMADRIGDVAVETLPAYRRQGHGKTAVSGVTKALLERGKVAVYATSGKNVASQSTALSTGYRLYGWQFRLQIPGPGLQQGAGVA